MTCPDCGSDETIKDSGQFFCKQCGLEIDELPISKTGKPSKEVVGLCTIEFLLNPRIELYALKLGLKNNKLADDWEQRLGFRLNSEFMKPQVKDKVLSLIEAAFERHAAELESSKEKIQQNWARINNRYFIEIEKYFKFGWPSDTYDCYLSLCSRFGYHNSSKNFIIIQQSLSRVSNYVIAHELLQIYLRKYLTRFFKEGYTPEDNLLTKIIAAYVLLTHAKISPCFPDMKFTFDIFSNEYKGLGTSLWPLWKNQKGFKEFIINTYDKLNIRKTWISY